MLERECIIIDDLVVTIKYGYSDKGALIEEPLHFDLKIFTDYKKAIVDDNLDLTVSYIEVANFVKGFTGHNSFSILENLASGVAKGLMDKFLVIDELQLQLRKTRARSDFRLHAFGVGFTLKREIAYLTLGSNLGDKEKNLTKAVGYLRSIHGINVLKVTNFVETEPYGPTTTKDKFLNGAVKIATYLEPEELLGAVKSIEKMLGRVETDTWGEPRTCDIDIIFFGDKKIRTDKLQIPHYDWHNRPHVKSLLKNLEPNLEI